MKVIIQDKEIDAGKTLFISTTPEDDTKVSCYISPDVSFTDAMQLLHTLSVHILNAFTVVANEGPLKPNATNAEMDKYTAIKKQIYSAYNEGASSVLELYAPEFELRPDVTTEAIQKVEKEIIEDKYNALNRERRRSTKDIISKTKKALKNATK